MEYIRNLLQPQDDTTDNSRKTVTLSYSRSEDGNAVDVTVPPDTDVNDACAFLGAFAKIISTQFGFNPDTFLNALWDDVQTTIIRAIALTWKEKHDND